MPSGWRTIEALWFEPVAYAYQVTGDMALAQRIGQLLPDSEIGKENVPDGGKGFAQGTRSVPNLMYYLSLLPRSVIPRSQHAQANRTLSTSTLRE